MSDKETPVKNFKEEAVEDYRTTVQLLMAGAALLIVYILPPLCIALAFMAAVEVGWWTMLFTVPLIPLSATVSRRLGRRWGVE
jgi:uncharacterized membrane protein